MQVFQTLDSTTFRYNGLKFVKLFMVIKQSETHLAIHNVYDTKHQLLASTHYNQIQVNGIIYNNLTELIEILTNLLFTKQTGGISGNLPIIGGTKTKISYDTAGFVVGGSDATTVDINETTNKRYQTDNQKAFNDATSSIQNQINSKANKDSPILTGMVTVNGGAGDTTIIKGQSNGTDTFLLNKDGFFKASRYELYGGLSSQFLKADGSTDSTIYSTLGNVTGIAGKYAMFKTGGGVWESQISESAGYVVVGGVGSYTEKLEVIGNIKANSFVGTATAANKLFTARNINGVAFDGTTNITINANDATPRIATSEKGAINGVATLDGSGLIPAIQLPSYVDDVLEYSNLSNFPATGTSGKIYVDLATNKTYRWSGSAYIFITSGAVDSVAGKTGVVTLVKADVGLSNVDNTADTSKSVSYANTAGSASANDVYAWAKTPSKPSYIKSEVGLSNVDNTADASKPVSNPTQTALNLKANINSPNFSWSVNVDTTTLSPQNAFTVTNGSTIVASVEKNGFFKGTRFELYGGLSSQFLKADGSTDSSTYASLSNVTGTAGKIARFKSGGGLETSEISESAGKVVVGGVGSMTEKFEVVGNIKATGFIGNGALLTSMTKSQVGLSNVDNTADSSKSVSYANSAGNASQLPTNYIGGQQLNPQTYFNMGIGLKVAMTAAAGVWSDTLWINGYAGADVKSMCALHFQRNGTPRVYISSQLSDATAYGTQYELLSTYNYNLYSPTLAGGGATGTWGINITGNANYANSAGSASANDVYAWAKAVSKPTYTKSEIGLGNIDNTTDSSKSVYYATTAGSAPANGGTSSQVTINYNNDANSTYQMLWGSGNGVYGTAGISCNPSSDTLYVNGDVIAFASSDIRLKDNIKPIENAIQKISKIGGYTFDWNKEQDVYSGNDVGVIAQEIEEILPQLVVTRENGYKAVKYEKLVALLIQGINEQQVQINELKELINK